MGERTVVVREGHPTMSVRVDSAARSALRELAARELMSRDEWFASGPPHAAGSLLRELLDAKLVELERTYSDHETC
jgi:hypothetical protein